MKFSIIIPAHNAADRLPKCLDSIRAQSFKDYELIVVCDCCTDDTERIAREQYGAITRTVHFHRDGLTRNRGLDMAKGDWILFLDDDDWWLHEFILEEIDRVLEAQKDVDILCFSFIWKGIGYRRPLDNGGHLFPAVWSKAWRRSFIGETRFTDHPRHSDLDFCNLIAPKEPRVRIWDFPVYYYNYLRPGSMSELAKQRGEEFESDL